MKTVIHSLLNKTTMLQTASAWSRGFAGVNSIPGVSGSFEGWDG
jgi:hypothetical protein